jgi:hypothetical protein
MELSPVEWGELLLLQQVSFLKLKSPNLGLKRRKKDGFPEFDRLNSAAMEREAASSMLVSEEAEEPQNPNPNPDPVVTYMQCKLLRIPRSYGGDERQP